MRKTILIAGLVVKLVISRTPEALAGGPNFRGDDELYLASIAGAGAIVGLNVVPLFGIPISDYDHLRWPVYGMVGGSAKATIDVASNNSCRMI